MDDDRSCSGTHAVAAFDGTRVAFARRQSLLIMDVTSRREQVLAGLTPSISSTISHIRFSKDASQLLLIHASGLQVYDCDARCERARLQNGSGGLGDISTAHFVDNDHLLIVWEFGKTKLFQLNSGKPLDLMDWKTTSEGRTWQSRPGNATPALLALLSRTSTGDQLGLHFSSLVHALGQIKLHTIDAQSLSWSPDGKWLAILDVPTATPNLYIYTPDGHPYRSYPATKDGEPGLGTKSLAWAARLQLLALAKYDGKVELLNTRTFSPLAIIEHSTLINQQSLAPTDKALIWLEHVSASGERSYTPQSQPISPPLSRAKTESEPKDLGIAELCFSHDGSYLATRDCRMLNTVWIWNMSSFALRAVVIQHADVRSLQWHPTQPDLLLIDCAEGFAHILDLSSNAPPTIFPTHMRPKAPLSWMNTRAGAKSVILVVEKSRFAPVFPQGCDDLADDLPRAPTPANDAAFEEGHSEDSLFDVLSGRKPLPPKTEPSYTEMVDLDMEEEDAINGDALEDTFREKKRTTRVPSAEVDPFDDSQIF